jgi:hypothetical protein
VSMRFVAFQGMVGYTYGAMGSWEWGGIYNVHVVIMLNSRDSRVVPSHYAVGFEVCCGRYSVPRAEAGSGTLRHLTGPIRDGPLPSHRARKDLVVPMEVSWQGSDTMQAQRSRKSWTPPTASTFGQAP